MVRFYFRITRVIIIITVTMAIIGVILERGEVRTREDVLDRTRGDDPDHVNDDVQDLAIGIRFMNFMNIF